MTDNRENRRPVELLAPAGDPDALKAAIRNGADAVYIGAPAFNARARARNFTVEELAEAIDYAHLRSVRVYIALNTLLTDRESEAAADLALKVWRHGADAIIVQDIGFAGLLRKVIPGIVLHASTQATIYDDNALEACAEIGFSRVILPRELSIIDIKRLTDKAHELHLGTEVFVHGALCVCWSGQCLLSSALGGRSGNRGECAQPCRLDYELETDGKVSGRPFPRMGLKDMAAIEYIKDLADSGVDSFKIEGRMRQPEYVGIVTGTYRSAIDSGTADDKSVSDLLLAFNRGGRFSSHYLRGEKSDDMMTGATTGSHGIYIGDVTAVNPRLGAVDYVVRELNGHPCRSDVISVRRKGESGEICSAPIAEPRIIDETRVRIKGFHPDIIEKIRTGDRVFRMSDAKRSREAADSDLGKTVIEGELSCPEGKICIRWTAGSLYGSRFVSEHCTDIDINGEYMPLPEERCSEQLSKSGGTPFAVSEVRILQSPSVPVALLNRLRRESFAKLENDLVLSYRRDINAVGQPVIKAAGKPANRKSPEVSVFLYEWDGSYDSLECGADIYELPVRAFLKEEAFVSIRILKENFPGVKVAVCLPPAFNAAFADTIAPVIRTLSIRGIDALMSGNPGNGKLASASGLIDMRDSAANVFNSYTAEMIFSQGAYSLVPSYELSPENIRMMTASCNSGIFELPVYGRTRLMYSEHCPVGYNRPGCLLCGSGSKFRLKDRKGAFLPVVLNSETCSAEILSPEIIFAFEEAVSLAEDFSVITRLLFYDEDIETRRALVDKCRKSLYPDTEKGGAT